MIYRAQSNVLYFCTLRIEYSDLRLNQEGWFIFEEKVVLKEFLLFVRFNEEECG